MTTTMVLPEEAHGIQYQDFDQWREKGRALIAKHSASQWDIADWLNHGTEDVLMGGFGEKAYAEAEKITGFTRQTLYDFVSVANTFPVSLRNYTGLTFNHYRVVAAVKDDAKREEWLMQAQAGKLSVRELRDKIAVTRKPSVVSADKPSRPTTVMLTTDERKCLDLLANHRGVEVSDILRPLVEEFVGKNTIQKEREAAEQEAKIQAAKNRKAARTKWEKGIVTSVDGILKRYEGVSPDRPTEVPDAEEFVEQFRRETGRKFTKRVFNLAMRRTELKAHYSASDAEAFGFPAPRKPVKKGRRRISVKGKRKASKKSKA